jgi:hypothetical protein
LSSIAILQHVPNSTFPIHQLFPTTPPSPNVGGELKSFNVAADAGEGLDAAVKDGVNVISFSIEVFGDV